MCASQNSRMEHPAMVRIDTTPRNPSILRGGVAQEI
jgi:hypothetical protein